MISTAHPIVDVYDPHGAEVAAPLQPATEQDYEERMTDDIADRVIPLEQALEVLKRISAAIEAL